MASEKHSWKFRRDGGVDQVILKTGEDIARLSELDKKLWVALACPVKGTEIDEETLALVDTDKDGRIRPPEVLGAIDWSKKVFKTLDVLTEKGEGVSISAFADTAEGKAVRASALRILADRGKADAKEIKLEDATGMEAVFAQTRLNGDGVVPPESADDEVTKKAIVDIMSTHGSVVDRSGKLGIDKARADAFFGEIDAYVAWYASGDDEALRPIGDATAGAASAIADVESKVNDYFTRCRLAAFDARGAASLSAGETELTSLATRELSTTDDAVAKLPIARIEGGRALPFDAGVNPAWSDRIARLAKTGIAALLGGSRTSLTEADWTAALAKVAPYRAWLAKKPPSAVDKLGVPRAKELAAPEVRKGVQDLIFADAALEAEYQSIASVEKAIRFRRELARFLRNFVSFADFYGGRGASFQAGTLFLDARSCDLVINVENAAKHVTLAALSGAYLVYCDCTRSSGEKRTIVAAFTDGDVDDLIVGRNGVFYDRKGNDWDATISSIVANPISIRQGFWSPYKRLVRMVEEQIAKRAAAKEQESVELIDKTAVETTHADELAAKEAALPVAAPAAAASVPRASTAQAKTSFDVGTIAALGVGIGAIGTVLGGAASHFFGMGVWMPVGLVVLVCGISGPSMLIAWLKLRRRNLGPVLDANGWAINNRAKINVPFGRSLTHLASLPPGASRTLDDPFAEKPPVWRRYVALAMVVLFGGSWFFREFDDHLPTKVRASTVLHRLYEAAPPPSQPPAPGESAAAPAAPAPSK